MVTPRGLTTASNAAQHPNTRHQFKQLLPSIVSVDRPCPPLLIISHLKHLQSRRHPAPSSSLSSSHTQPAAYSILSTCVALTTGPSRFPSVVDPLILAKPCPQWQSPENSQPTTPARCQLEHIAWVCSVPAPLPIEPRCAYRAPYPLLGLASSCLADWSTQSLLPRAPRLPVSDTDRPAPLSSSMSSCWIESVVEAESVYRAQIRTFVCNRWQIGFFLKQNPALVRHARSLVVVVRTALNGHGLHRHPVGQCDGSRQLLRHRHIHSKVGSRRTESPHLNRARLDIYAIYLTAALLISPDRGRMASSALHHTPGHNLPASKVRSTLLQRAVPGGCAVILHQRHLFSPRI